MQTFRHKYFCLWGVRSENVFLNGFDNARSMQAMYLQFTDAQRVFGI